MRAVVSLIYKYSVYDGPFLHCKTIQYKTMNIQEYNKVLKNMPGKVQQRVMEGVIIPAANVMLASIINRNVRDGKNTDGSKRPGYSTRPGYYSPKQFVKKSAFKPQGKNGSKKGAKTMYLPAGYKQLREIQGRKTEVVNAEYTGDTMLAFTLGKENETTAVIGFNREKASRVRKSLEKRYGSMFKPSQQEVANYKKEVTEQSKQLQRNIIFNVS